MMKAIVGIAVSILVFQSGCKNRNEGSPLTEEWDKYNAPELFGVKSVEYETLKKEDGSRGMLPNRPWEDTYWPLSAKNMAKRYVNYKNFDSFAEQIADAQDGHTDPHTLSPAEKYDMILGDENWSMTKESWDTYSYYKNNYSGNWSWMGICHGWAAASYMEKAPARSVLVTSSAKPEEGIIFFEGDIRGLLSKAYATNASDSSSSAVGSRCNLESSDIKRDEHGRPLDGVLTDESGKTRNLYVLKNLWEREGLLEVTDDLGHGQSFWLLATGSSWNRGQLGPSRDNTPFDVFVYDYGSGSEEMLTRDMEIREYNGASKMANYSQKATVQFYKVCRDLNPGSFHAVLVRYLSDIVKPEDKKGFVLELDRALQVWNHPIWGFSSKLGDLIPVEQDEAKTKYLRAEGTTHIAKVDTTLVYITEKGPDTEYAKNTYKIDWENLNSLPHPVRTKELSYTLEFDKDGFIIGGEWDESPGYLANTPDFIWLRNGSLTDGTRSWSSSFSVKYSAVKRILECSFDDASVANFTVRIGGKDQTFEVARCEI